MNAASHIATYNVVISVETVFKLIKRFYCPEIVG